MHRLAGGRQGETVMSMLTRDGARLRPFRPTIECAQCGELLFLPEWTEYHDNGRIKHLWACESCGYSFETTVRYTADAA
jgi:hypothetical protein